MTSPTLESPHLADARATGGASPEERAVLREHLTRALPEIPPIYFYDDLGSDLFEQITNVPEYYPTRTEIGILERVAPDILATVRPRRIAVLGSGAGRKIRLLLDAWPAAADGESCTMLDVNERFLEDSLACLRADYPRYEFRAVVGDFTKDLGLLGEGGERLTVFFGGTIGNLYPDARGPFFQSLARGMVASDALLLGVDLVKDTARLEAAYDDAAGVTATFNRNALHVLNRRFGADFDVEAFSHRAFYDAENAWIEMRLRAERAVEVRVPALDLHLSLERGAEIRTEVSCKFTRDSVAAAAALGGLEITRLYTDPEALFALAILRPTRAASGGGAAHE